MRQTKTRAFSWLLMLVMAFSLISPGSLLQVQAEETTTLAPNAEGTYELGSADDFLAFAAKVNAGEKTLNAVLTKDIDMTDKTWVPITEYAGTFDGQNHKIENLTFESTDKDQGIFGTNTGTIENITDITGTYTANHTNIGGLTAYNKGNVINCHSSVKIICNNADGYVGGLVAYNTTDKALVEKCSFEGSITIPADSTVSGAHIGGIVGRQRTGKPYIIGCVNRGTIINENSEWMYIGGIAGYADGGNIWFSYNEGTLQAASTETYISGIAYSAKPYNCYSVGTLTGGDCYPIAPSSGTNNYYLSDAEEQGARTDEEFKKNSMVSALNALTTSMKSLVLADCMFEQSNGYPTLVWEGKGIKVTPVAVKSATINGDALSGVTLTAAITGVNDKEPTSVSYQWQVSNEEGYEDIADAVYPTFALPDTEAYVGKQLRVVVTGGNDSKIISESTSVIGKSDKLRVTEDKAELQSFASPILEDCQLTLPVKGSNGSAIAWESNKPEVISNDGKVTLPTADKVSVSITATITYNKTTDTKTFSVQVQSVDYQDALADSKAIKLASTRIYEAQTLELPLKGENGSVITWTSNKTDYITNEGVVTLPETGTQSVTLKATITKNDTVVTSSFWVTVYSLDKGNVTQDKEELSIETSVRKAGKMKLPKKGTHGSTITWTSNKEDVIASNGMVTLPESGVVSVTLKATLASNEVTDTRSFAVKVCSEEAQTKQVNVTFTLVGDDVHGANPHKAYYNWLSNVEEIYTEADQKTVSDLINDVFAEYGFTRLGQPSYISGIVTPDGITLGEKMNGSGSGWMYSVNGKAPNVGVTGYTLKDGDAVKLYYVHSWGDKQEDPQNIAVESIALGVDEITLLADDTQKLNVTFQPVCASNRKINWQSSDETVAQVSKNGVVTGKGKGTAVITGTSDENNALTVQCTVHVNINYLKNAKNYLKKTVTEPTVASTGGEWAVLSLARAGVKDLSWYNHYYKQVEEVVKVKGNKLSSTKSTENSRVIIGLTAIGADPANVMGENLLEPLADYDYVVNQGINGATYALIALDTADYKIPTVKDVENATTREKLIAYLLGRELSSGGWTFGEPTEASTADVDMTAMVIQALAPYYTTDSKVKTSIDKGLTVLSNLQGEDGRYTSVYEYNGVTYKDTSSESCSQVVCALAALGLDAQTDERFVKNGNSVMDALLTFYDEESGGFKHSQEDEVVPNLMATEQAAYALVAYDRYQNGKNGLYDMSDVECLYRCEDDEHEWDEGIVTKEATVEETGVKTFTCTICGATRTEDIPKLDKKPEQEEPEQPTTPDTPQPPVTPEPPTTPDTPQPPATPEQPTTPQPPATPEQPATTEEKVVVKEEIEEEEDAEAAEQLAIIKAPTKNTVKTSKKKQVKVIIKKKKYVTGYQIQISKNSKFKKATIYKIKKSALNKTIKGLDSGSTYYIRTRSYKKVVSDEGTELVYGKWSKVKKVKVK